MRRCFDPTTNRGGAELLTLASRRCWSLASALPGPDLQLHFTPKGALAARTRQRVAAETCSALRTQLPPCVSPRIHAIYSFDITMADPFVDDDARPSQPAPAPAKRSMFKNRQRTSVPKTEEPQAAIDFFSRSREIFPESVRIEKEEREREEARKRERGRSKRLKGDEVTRGKRGSDGEAANEDDDEGGARKKNKRYVDFIGRGEGEWQANRSASQLRVLTPPLRERSSSTTSRNGSPQAAGWSPRTQRTQQQALMVSISDSEDEATAPNNPKTTDSGPIKIIDFDQFDDYESPNEPFAKAPEIDPIAIPSSPEEEEPFPELVEAARQRAEQEAAQRLLDARKRLGQTSKQSVSSAGPSGSGAQLASSSPMPSRAAAPPDPIVNIFVDSRIAGTAPLMVKRKLNQRLKDVRMAWCDKQLIDGCPMTNANKEGIFLTWKGRRVWDVTTAESMGVKVDGRGRIVGETEGPGGGVNREGNIHLQAWTTETFREFEAQRDSQRKASQPADPFSISDDDEDGRYGEPQVQEVAAKAGEKIKIVLQAKGMEVVKLIVKPTTVIKTVMNAFRQTRRIEEGKIVELWFDGERLEEETTIGDADLEDLSGIDVLIK
jgi:hypothetical protein